MEFKFAVDHVIRTKGLPLVLRGLLQLVETDQQTQIVQYLQSQVDNYIQQYHDYFTTQNQQSKVKKVPPFARFINPFYPVFSAKFFPPNVTFSYIALD